MTIMSFLTFSVMTFFVVLVLTSLFTSKSALRLLGNIALRLLGNIALRPHGMRVGSYIKINHDVRWLRDYTYGRIAGAVSIAGIVILRIETSKGDFSIDYLRYFSKISKEEYLVMTIMDE